jgi:hypothetical protein
MLEKLKHKTASMKSRIKSQINSLSEKHSEKVFEKSLNKLESTSNDSSSEYFREEPEQTPYKLHVLGYHRKYLGYTTKKIQVVLYSVFLILVILLIIKLMRPENLQNLTQ